MILFLFNERKEIIFFWKAYLIHEMTVAGACRANKGTRKDF